MNTFKPAKMLILKICLIVTDVSFIAYWFVTAFHLILPQMAFKHYENPLVAQWNWSFLFLDLIISISGLTSIWLQKQNNPIWEKVALVSLTLTFCSGLQAIGYWVIGREFDLQWWLPNLFLLIYPIPFIAEIVLRKS